MEKCTKHHKELISNLNIFKGVQPKSIDHLTRSASEKTFVSGKTIIHYGDKSDGIYILKEGSLGVYVYSNLYEKPILVNIIKPYSIVGELSEVFNIPRGGEVSAITQSTLLKIPTYTFQKCLDENPIMYKTLCKQIYEWLLSANQKVLQNFSTTENSIYHLLMSLDKEDEGYIEITQDQISRMIGISRESVSKSIKKLKSKKILRQERGKIFLTGKGEEHES